MIRDKALALALLVAAAFAATAAPPAFKIDTKVEPTGQYLIIAPETDAVSVVYIGLDGADPFPTTELRDSRKFVLSVRGLKEVRYRFAAVAASENGEQVRADFTVTLGTPPIPPGPGPGPGPGPVLTGLAKITHDAAMKVNDPKTAKQYAANHAAIVSAIAAGAYKSLTFDQARAAIFKDLAAANRITTQSAPAWSEPLTAVSNEMNALSKAGNLNSVAAISEALDQIRTGFEAAGAH